MGDKEVAFNNIIDDVKDQELLILNQIKDEIKTSFYDQLDMFKVGLKKEIDIYFERELNELRNLSAILASKAKLRSKREILSRRESLVNTLFNEVLSGIKDYVKSDDYKNYILKKLDEIKNISDDSYFLVRKEDMNLMSAILKDKKINREVRESDIQIGGFVFVDNISELEYDFSFDTNLEEQKEWFVNYSGFTL